ncbi:hypothetical protein X975_06274, partial [Stegodyphus mimosarum]
MRLELYDCRNHVAHVHMVSMSSSIPGVTIYHSTWPLHSLQS